MNFATEGKRLASHDQMLGLTRPRWVVQLEC